MLDSLNEFFQTCYLKLILNPYLKRILQKRQCILKNHWINILGMKFELITSLRLLKHEKAALLKHAINYFKLHLQQFKPTKSLEILNELFKVS